LKLPDRSNVEEFTKWATSPSAWFNHAEQLNRSSELLWVPIGRMFDLEHEAFDQAAGSGAAQGHDAAVWFHSYAYLLVAGFAIEAMLKAAAIQSALNDGGIDRVIVVGPAPRLQSWLKTHKLESLAARAGVECDEELRTYIRRFEKYILWAGRYPVPIAPSANTEPRGFDYQIGVQDEVKFRQIFGLAGRAYLRARDAENARPESTAAGEYRQREAVWMMTRSNWLRVVRPALLGHATRVANGDRGVLQINVDTPEMERHLTAPPSIVRLVPIWLPAEEFVAVVGDRSGVGAETGRRWAEELRVMDPSRDVALFLHSTPDPEGRWFSRFIFLKNAKRDG
jgi:hypothetical protein